MTIKESNKFSNKNKNNIECSVGVNNYMGEGMVQRPLELTVQGRVLPCCYYATYIKNPDSELTDPVWDKLFEEDPDWNNAVVHGFDKVSQHEIWWTHIWDEGFDSDNPPPICAHFCTKNKK